MGAFGSVNNCPEKLKDRSAVWCVYSFHCTTQPRSFEAFRRNFPIFSPSHLFLPPQSPHSCQQPRPPALMSGAMWGRGWGPVTVEAGEVSIAPSTPVPPPLPILLLPLPPPLPPPPLPPPFPLPHPSPLPPPTLLPPPLPSPSSPPPPPPCPPLPPFSSSSSPTSSLSSSSPFSFSSHMTNASAAMEASRT